LVLVDVKLGPGAGNLVVLRRYPDRLEGRFTGQWAAFMTMRHPGEIPRPRAEPLDSAAHPGAQRMTYAPAQPWQRHREMWMFATQTVPEDVTIGYLLDPDTRRPTAATLTAPDGSWCHVHLMPDRQTDTRVAGSGHVDNDRGIREVSEAGPTPLWARVESAYDQWLRLGRPGWERFGLTVTARSQALWIDDPEHPLALAS
jgi:hypothetical protein